METMETDEDEPEANNNVWSVKPKTLNEDPYNATGQMEKKRGQFVGSFVGPTEGMKTKETWAS